MYRKSHMVSLWKYYKDIEKWEDTPQDRQDEIIEALMTDTVTKTYNYPSTLFDVIYHLTDEKTIIKLFDHFIHKGGEYALGNDASYAIVHQVHDKVKNKQYVIDAIQKSKYKKLHRAFLLLKNRTEKEEELGLRALSGVKYAPDVLYTNRYKPNFNAVQKLPPIMRLKALEALLSNTNIAYNIFENCADEDEFKKLLFGSVLRHRDRVEVICDKYREMKDLGSEATVLIKCNCENCGEYEVTVKSTRVRTQTGLDTTRIGQFMSNKSCALCGRWGENDKQVICEA